MNGGFSSAFRPPFVGRGYGIYRTSTWEKGDDVNYTSGTYDGLSG